MQTFALLRALIYVSRYREREERMLMQYTPAQRTRFAQTVVDCRPGMYRIALGMLRSPADAEDAVSAAVVTAYARLHALRNESALPAYLMKCTVNACRAALRKRKRELPTQNMAIYESSAPEGDNVWEYLHALPEKYRLPLMLRYSENWSLLDVARFLHLPKGTVSSRISRGLDMLKKELETED